MKTYFLTLWVLMVCFVQAYSQNQSNNCKNLVVIHYNGGRTHFFTLDGKKTWEDKVIYGFQGFSEGLAGCAESANFSMPKFGFINNKGIWVIKPKYEFVKNFKDGLAAIMINKKWGYINTKGILVIPAKFDLVCEFYDGAAVVRVGDKSTGKYGVIDKSGKYIVAPKFPANFARISEEDNFRFVDGLCPMFDGQKWGYINKAGEFQIPAQYWAANYFSEGLAAVAVNGGVRFINSKGETKIETNYTFNELSWYYYMKNGFAVYEKNNGSGLINRNGVVIIDHKNVNEMRQVSDEGLVCFEAYPSNLWGIMDTTGRKVVEPKYEFMHRFKYGYCVVQEKQPYSVGRPSNASWYHLIDSEGKLLSKVSRNLTEFSIICLDE